MKTMVQKAGIEKTENSKVRNHSSRKTVIQILSEHDIPPTQIFSHLSGHKNLKSIENYSTVSTKQQGRVVRKLVNINPGLNVN